MNHWETKKGKEVLFNCFKEITEFHTYMYTKYNKRNIRHTKLSENIHRKYGYKKSYIEHALTQLCILGLISSHWKMKYVYYYDYQYYRITEKGAEFWEKRTGIKIPM